MTLFRYDYVGPESIRASVSGSPAGTLIHNLSELNAWLDTNSEALDEGATYVVGLDGVWRLAPRRSEHVACAGGGAVLAAGEVQFDRNKRGPFVSEISNQSTGYCPEPDCWPAVAQALSAAGIEAPPTFTQEFLFRRCSKCGERNLVKEGWFVCALCEAELPREWNFGSRSDV